MSARPDSVLDTRNGTFAPRRWLANGHAMTVFAWARRRAFPDLPPAERRLIRVAPDTEVRVDAYWQSRRTGRPTLVALHGLEGSSEVHYMRGLAAKAWRRGWNAALVNQRNCGGTEHLTPGLYHSGLTDDPREVMRALAREGLGPFVVAGYSLGGNLAVKLAGELPDTADVPIAAVAAVCPTIELETCVRAIERRRNYPYQWNFVRNLRGRMRRKAAAWPAAYDLTGLDRIWTIRAFDERYTAPHHGFAGASDYYHRASAMRLVDRIRVPTLILAAADDPFVPPAQFTEGPVARQRSITVRVEPHGGHCGFVTETTGECDGYWAEDRVVAFLAISTNSVANAAPLPSSSCLKNT
jgi:predicted alpha/beta-fold hydrolase